MSYRYTSREIWLHSGISVDIPGKFESRVHTGPDVHLLPNTGPGSECAQY